MKAFPCTFSFSAVWISSSVGIFVTDDLDIFEMTNKSSFGTIDAPATVWDTCMTLPLL